MWKRAASRRTISSSDPVVARGRSAEERMETANCVRCCLLGTQQGDGGSGGMSHGDGLCRGLPTDIGAGAQLRDCSQIDLMLVL